MSYPDNFHGTPWDVAHGECDVCGCTAERDENLMCEDCAATSAAIDAEYDRQFDADNAEFEGIPVLHVITTAVRQMDAAVWGGL